MTLLRRISNGQAAVEAAMALPLMTFLILAIIQLGMMEQAKIMTQLAAYRAARAGVVNDADCDLMLNSAMTALVPTFGETPPLPGVRLLLPNSRADDPLRAFRVWQTYVQLNKRVAGPLGFPLVQVDVLNPKKSALPGLFSKYGKHLTSKEIDFDDVRDDAVRDANILSVRVKYWFRLRVPFANWEIQSMWVGQQILKYYSGVVFNVQSVFGVSHRTADELWGLKQGGDWRLSAKAALLAKALNTSLYYIPITGSYSMRMQSNLMRSRVSPCAVDN